MPQLAGFQSDEHFARELDRQDPLAGQREAFFIPEDLNGNSAIYLCGNSLGPQPKAAAAAVEQVMDQWRRLAVRGHFSGERPWIQYHRSLQPLFAAIIGADPDEVIPMGTLTGNIHLLLSTFYHPQGRRRKILAIGGGFPSDRYALETMLALRQMDLHPGGGFTPDEFIVQIFPDPGEVLFSMETIHELIEALGEELALVYLPAVPYTTGQVLDLQAITAWAHEQGALAGFDLAHAAGNVPLRLHEWGVDFAAWCGYKYLSGGPGHGGGLYVHQRHVQNPRLVHPAGWWGNDPQTRFEMRPSFEPILTAERFQLSNPAVLALAPMLASLTLYVDAGLDRIWEKSRKQSAYLLDLLDNHNTGDFKIITPRDPALRGNQISIQINGDAVVFAEQLLERGVVIDERPPHILRVAPMPLFNTYLDIWQFVQIFADVLQREDWK